LFAKAKGLSQPLMQNTWYGNRVLDAPTHLQMYYTSAMPLPEPPKLNPFKKRRLKYVGAVALVSGLRR